MTPKDQWYVRDRQDHEFGPITSEELRRATALGRIRSDSLVRKSDSPHWVKAERINGLFKPAAASSRSSVAQAPLLGVPVQPASETTGNRRRIPLFAVVAIVSVSFGLLGVIGFCSTAAFLLQARNTPTLPQDARASTSTTAFASLNPRNSDIPPVLDPAEPARLFEDIRRDPSASAGTYWGTGWLISSDQHFGYADETANSYSGPTLLAGDASRPVQICGVDDFPDNMGDYRFGVIYGRELYGNWHHDYLPMPSRIRFRMAVVDHDRYEKGRAIVMPAGVIEEIVVEDANPTVAHPSSANSKDPPSTHLSTEETLDLFLRIRENPRAYVDLDTGHVQAFYCTGWLRRVDLEEFDPSFSQKYMPTLLAGPPDSPFTVASSGDRFFFDDFGVTFLSMKQGREAVTLPKDVKVRFAVALWPRKHRGEQGVVAEFTIHEILQ